MEKATAARCVGCYGKHELRPCIAIAFGLVGLACHAQEIAQADAEGEASTNPTQVALPTTFQLEVSAKTLPRLDSSDISGSRLDLSLLPQHRTGLGLIVGMAGWDSQDALTGGTAVDLGLHWRHRLTSDQQIDVTAWRRMTAVPDDAYTLIERRQPLYGARVEMRIAPARTRWLATGNRFIGFQLEGGSTITLRRKDGKPMIYYRTNF